jgi:uncharacterized membrane protein YphA (DoxX/SURF4 family)
MKNGESSLSRHTGEAAAVIARWLLGALFVYMGLQKALHPVEFLKLVREYHLVTTPWMLNSIAACLPWFEMFCGLLLLAGIAVRGAALAIILMLVPFTAIVAQRAVDIHAGQGIPFCAVKFDCGCGNGEVFICRKIAENVLATALACWLLFTRAGRRLCLRYQLFPRGQPDPPASFPASGFRSH